MFHLALPFTDLNLFLAPRWGEAPRPLDVLPWLVVCLVPLGLVLWLYRYELRLISRAAALVLLGLRLAVLFILLFLVCLQPALARTTREDVPQRVYVAVDRTASMEVADPQREPVEKLRLAGALHLARDVCSDLQIEEWVRAYEKGGGPRWVADDEYPDDPERRKQLEAERRRQHDQVCQRVDGFTRNQLARRLLDADGAGLLTKLSGRFQVELIGFADETWDAPPDKLDDLFGKDVRPRSPALAFTDLGRPLDRVLEKAGEGKDQVRGVILLTDGRHNRGPVPGGRADRLGERKIPIYPVAIGTRKSGPELAVTGVTANNAVFKAREDIVNATVKASLKVRSLPAQELVVELQGMGRTLDRKRITHDGKDHDYPLSFPVSLNQEGTQKLTVSVRPAPGQAHTDNNRRAVAVKVVDDQAEVLLIEGEARWEYHYLASALARDDLVKRAKGVVFVQPRIGRIDEAELEKAGHPSLKLPAGPDAFSVYDCVVLGDVSPEQLPRADRKRLEKYVGERGGTLVILAGKRFMPL
ncbi:MAG TPA: vWA domain-containing protein, partial [Gemmataceae bacterium]|nr:vWA domain-containing protein [Gemmataceae bacterium]